MNRERLKRDVERIKKHRLEKAAVGQSERDIFKALKEDEGISPKALRRLLSIEAMKDRAEVEDAMSDYAVALGWAVEEVRSGRLSLREAEAASGASKSSIHRALAVPELSQPADVPCACVALDTLTRDTNGSRSLPVPPPNVWHAITAPVLERLAAEEAERAAKEAERARKAAEREVVLGPQGLTRIPAEPDITLPDFLRRAPATVQP